MAHPGLRRIVAGTAVPLLLAAGLSGCGGDDEPSSGAPEDATAADFCRELEDAPGADATADDYRAYADRLEETGTPGEISGDARDGFELFVGYLGDLGDDDVAKVKESDEPSDVFSGDDAGKVEAFKQGYVVTCTADPTGEPTTGESPTPDATGGVLPGLSGGTPDDPATPAP